MILLLCGCGTDARRPDLRAMVESEREDLRRTLDLERALEARAAAARNDLEAARRAAEILLTPGDGAAAQRPAGETRADALRALRAGSKVLRLAAEVGSRAAESWARVIQDRMMRLEETLDHLTGAERHADS